MSDNAFDMVRKLRHLPGIEVTAIINPAKITTRVKNATKKMLRSGVLVGGYMSKSRMLAEQLLKDAGVQAVASNTKWSTSVSDMSLLTRDDRAHLTVLLEAARMIELASEPRNGSYINDRYTHILQQVKQQSGRLSFSIYQPAIQMQIAEVVAARRTPEQVAAHEALAVKLDSTEPFAVNF
jgi:hypothetical protein